MNASSKRNVGDYYGQLRYLVERIMLLRRRKHPRDAHDLISRSFILETCFDGYRADKLIDPHQ